LESIQDQPEFKPRPPQQCQDILSTNSYKCKYDIVPVGTIFMMSNS